MTQATQQKTALVTGGSRGLGNALSHGLAAAGWNLIIDGRDPATLEQARRSLDTTVTAIAGDIADPRHRSALAVAVDEIGRLDLYVANAGTLGPSPLPPLASVDEEELAEVYRINVIAPILLFQAVRPALEAAEGIVMAITSDAAHGDWPGWGAYGSSKAALEQAVNVLGSEHPQLRVYSVDPGDMRTNMHQLAFPGEDISDRPEPTSVVPGILELIASRPENGRHAIAQQPVTP